MRIIIINIYKQHLLSTDYYYYAQTRIHLRIKIILEQNISPYEICSRPNTLFLTAQWLPYPNSSHRTNAVSGLGTNQA